MLHTLVTAAGAVEPDPTLVTPGLLGLVILLLLGLAVALLIRSMGKQLRRIDVPHEADLGKADAQVVLPGAAATDDKQN